MRSIVKRLRYWLIDLLREKPKGGGGPPPEWLGIGRTNPELEALAEASHRSSVAYVTWKGWPMQEKHARLYEYVPEDIKELNRVTVRAVLEALLDADAGATCRFLVDRFDAEPDPVDNLAKGMIGAFQARVGSIKSPDEPPAFVVGWRGAAYYCLDLAASGRMAEIAKRVFKAEPTP